MLKGRVTSSLAGRWWHSDRHLRGGHLAGRNVKRARGEIEARNVLRIVAPHPHPQWLRSPAVVQHCAYMASASAGQPQQAGIDVDAEQFDCRPGRCLHQRPGFLHGAGTATGSNGELTSQLLAWGWTRRVQPKKDCRHLPGAQVDRWRRERELDGTFRIVPVEGEAKSRSSALVVQGDLHSGAVNIVGAYHTGLDPQSHSGYRRGTHGLHERCSRGFTSIRHEYFMIGMLSCVRSSELLQGELRTTKWRLSFAHSGEHEIEVAVGKRQLERCSQTD